MIKDPEKEPERWDELILASDPQEAKRECHNRRSHPDRLLVE